MKYLDIESWNRKNHFHFFREFEEPFWGITVHIDCTKAYENAKKLGCSFFIYYLHKSICAVNFIEEFRYRIDDQNRVIIHEKIGASATINRANGTFGFSYIPFSIDFSEFEANAIVEIERVRSNDDLTPASSSDNVVHYSSVPWISFSALSHARKFSKRDSVPKISFGKITTLDGKKSMPVSIHGHHALMDGYHVAKHIEKFQELMDNP